MNANPLTSSAERTLRLIEILMAEPDGLTPQEMLVVLDTSRSSLFNLLSRLKALGYVEQAERRGRYRAGPRLTAWRSAPSDSMQTLLSAFYLEAGHHSWPETLLLCVSAADGVLILGQVESTQPVRSSYPLGEVSQPLAAAKTALELNPPEVVSANGYALAQPPQIFELALPVCPDGSTPQAVLLLSAAAYRWTEETLLAECLPELRTMAARLSYRLGAPSYAPYLRSQTAEMRPESQLTPDEITKFLEGPWTARLACVRPDGKPHVIPVWQAWDGAGFMVIAWQGSQWAEYLALNPSVSLTIDEPWPPFRRVVARGRAVQSPFPANHTELDNLVKKLGQRYLGASAATLKSENVQRIFTIEVDSLRGWQGLPGSAAQPGNQNQ